ncbi:MAG: SAM-dependent methyltransferase [Candidatus Taylorbacteria bacterium]|nr:SAM-dependent methyltransferase [Candidatus Taylorbacteria bacterium]
MKTKVMNGLLQTALSNPAVVPIADVKFVSILCAIGLPKSQAQSLSSDIINQLVNRETNGGLVVVEKRIFASFGKITVSGKPMLEVMRRKFSDRAYIVCEQVLPYLKHLMPGKKVVDLGCGDGRVSDLVQMGLPGVIVTGYDTELYKAPGVAVDIYQYDGIQTGAFDRTYDGGIITNVLHHTLDKKMVLRELARIIKPGGRVVVLETVPSEPGQVARSVTFLVDYFYNRILHDSDVNVPGAFELAKDWPLLFEEVGFDLAPIRDNVTDLGIDQVLVPENHYRFVLERRG